MKEVKKMVHISTASIYRYMEKKKFPQAIRLSDRVSLWSLSLSKFGNGWRIGKKSSRNPSLWPPP
jgi:hypothetical protein